MSQHDLDIANQGFAAFRADLNNALQALGSLSSGDTAPATPYANQLWYETDTNTLHIRNEANSAWLDLMVIDQSTGSPSFTGQTTFADGSASSPSISNIGDTNAGIFFPAADTVAFSTDGSERLRLDASGNLGLGVTPSAWNSAIKGFELGSLGNGLWGQNNTNTVAVTSNAYYDAVGWKYGVTGRLATHYLQNAGTHSWYTAPSGTAGNAITFTQAMTLDASGNLGVGTSSPTSRLAVSGGGVTIGGFQAGSGSTLELGFDGTQAIIQGYNRTGSAFLPVWIESSLTRFGTGGVERARIDSSGNLLVGKTTAATAGEGHYLTADGAAGHTRVSNPALSLRRDTTDGQCAAFLRGATQVGSISVTTTATAYNTSSDYRLKEDVQPMVGASDRVLALKPVNFAWKADGSRTDGFIAHEVQEVAPYAVLGEKDGEEMQAMDHSKLVPLLTAALQEALTEIAALKARLAAANL